MSKDKRVDAKKKEPSYTFIPWYNENLDPKQKSLDFFTLCYSYCFLNSLIYWLAPGAQQLM